MIFIFVEWKLRCKILNKQTLCLVEYFHLERHKVFTIMKRNCPECGKEKTYKSKVGFARAVKNNTLCQSCANKWDRVFGTEKANEMRYRYSEDNTGKTLPEETKQKIRISVCNKWARDGYPQSGIEKLKQRTPKPHTEKTINKLKQYTGEKSSAVQTILKERNITYDEYLSTIPEWKRYYNEVQRITNQQPITILENYNKRGRAKHGTDAYHLDHIISIKYGFDNDIDPSIIGNISNLRMIPWLENLKKSSNRLE
jgi:hypothetical protein